MLTPHGGFGVFDQRDDALAAFYNADAMGLEQRGLTTDAGFWPAAAAAVRDFATRHGAADRQFGAVTWLVPNGAHAVLARAALRTELGGVAFVPPRIAPLHQWLGRPLESGTAARVELFAALRGSDWARSAFGAQPAALWALASGIAQLCDELSWAAIDDAEAFGRRLQASLARHFHRRALRAVQPEAQLVLQLWHARRGATEGAPAALRELQRRAAAASAPLVYTGALDELAAWERAFLQHTAGHAPVLLLVPDLAAAVASRPLLAAAWPELARSDTSTPLAARADTARGLRLSRPLSVVAADTLEAEATTIAQQVLDWLHEGIAPIALVALDRLTARRVRALLERAQVNVRDETGWKLSTTSAAAAVMRWIELAADDLYWRDLLDWLKSTFTLAGRTDKATVTAVVERAIRSGGTLQGAGAIRRSIVELARKESVALSEGSFATALDLLAAIELHVNRARDARVALAEHARLLGAALDALAMRPALAADPVGAAVLRELDALASDVADIAGRFTLADFRALLAARFEQVSYFDRAVDSPVVMVSPAATALRPFSAAILIGADAQRLPAAGAETLFMSNAVRAELGLATADTDQRAQAGQLAALLTTTPQVLATWRSQHRDEPNSVSPLLERLRFVASRALGDDLSATAQRREFAVVPAAMLRPAPSAPQLMPARLSASQAQSLVRCAYQFYARKLLGLARLEDVLEAPDKRDFGEALHDVLRRFHEAWGDTDFSRVAAAELAADLQRHGQSVFASQIERAPSMLAYQRRFHGLIDGYVAWLQQQSRDGWRWLAAEQAHAQPLQLRDGRVVELVGRIDRIDAHADGRRQRVLDYKARAAHILKKELAHGRARMSSCRCTGCCCDARSTKRPTSPSSVRRLTTLGSNWSARRSRSPSVDRRGGRSPAPRSAAHRRRRAAACTRRAARASTARCVDCVDAITGRTAARLKRHERLLCRRPRDRRGNVHPPRLRSATLGRGPGLRGQRQDLAAGEPHHPATSGRQPRRARSWRSRSRAVQPRRCARG
jgi:ATP-dependent helicase/nuclease subunit B